MQVWLGLIGLIFTGGGAFVASRAVIITDEQAEILSGTYWGGNNAFRDALKSQSHHARTGLLCVVVGTALQAFALLWPFVAT
jgi:hypothetical protein